MFDSLDCNIIQKIVKLINVEFCWVKKKTNWKGGVARGPGGKELKEAEISQEFMIAQPESRPLT